MARAYYGTRISDNMTKTPEGYLICHNVPLARTGWYDYDRSEIGLDGVGMVKVYRDEAEVFHPAAIASFEGKTVSEGHPSEYPISIHNDANYSKGHAQNVRRGEGEFGDCLVGDLFVKDPVTVNKIENGLREVSCGYDCEWMPLDDERLEQKQIRGNHIAIVENGRAGDRVAIRDEYPKKSKKEKAMKIDFKHIFGLGLKEFAKDAEPEEVAKAFETAKEEKSTEDCHGKDALPAATNGEGGAMMEMLKAIHATLQQLVQSDKQVHEQIPGDDLSQLEAELEKPEVEDVEGYMAGGQFHPIRGSEGYSPQKAADPNRHISGGDSLDELTGEIPTLSEEDRPDNPIPGADSKKAVLVAIKAMKPIIAGIKDSAERKKASDELAKSFRDMLVPASKSPVSGSYANLLAVKKSEDKATQDQAAQDENYGKNLKEKYHRKNIAGGK